MTDRIGAAARGSNAAWQEIVAELGPAVQGFARARGIEEPEELTQDVFLDAARRIQDFEGDWQSFRSWIFTIAYRRVADYHRRRSRQLLTVPYERRHDSAHRAPSPEECVDRGETVRELLRELDGLTDLERDVVLLRVIGELSSAQVAEIVGKSPGNVRVIQNRALSKVRESIEKKCVTNSVPQRLPS